MHYVTLIEWGRPKTSHLVGDDVCCGVGDALNNLGYKYTTAKSLLWVELPSLLLTNSRNCHPLIRR